MVLLVLVRVFLLSPRAALVEVVHVTRVTSVVTSGITSGMTMMTLVTRVSHNVSCVRHNLCGHGDRAPVRVARPRQSDDAVHARRGHEVTLTFEAVERILAGRHDVLAGVPGVAVRQVVAEGALQDDVGADDVRGGGGGRGEGVGLVAEVLVDLTLHPGQGLDKVLLKRSIGDD